MEDAVRELEDALWTPAPVRKELNWNKKSR
jgi:hypothetical protein